MTTLATDAEFRAKLNEDPTDWQTMLVYADFLRDTGSSDPRADGFHFLGQHKLAPRWFPRTENWGFWGNEKVFRHGMPKHYVLPDDLLALVERNRHVQGGCEHIYTCVKKPKNHNGCLLLRAVALAFTKLPETRQLELLSQEVL